MKQNTIHTKITSTALFAALFCFASTRSFAEKFPERAELNIEKCLNATVDDVNHLGASKLPEPQRAARSPIVGILVSAAITKGIDIVGEQLTSASEESMKSRTASVNVFPGSDKISARCLTFKTSESADIKNTNEKAIEFKIRLDGHSLVGHPPYYMKPKLTELKYYRTLSGKRDKERGLMVQLAISGPGNSNAESQTINIGNIETQNKPYDEGEIEFPTMINPYVTRFTDGKGNITKTTVGGPFTISVTLTETKDANEALGFVASVFSEANDDLTSAIISVTGVANDDDGTTAGEGASSSDMP